MLWMELIEMAEDRALLQTLNTHVLGYGTERVTLNASESYMLLNYPASLTKD